MFYYVDYVSHKWDDGTKVWRQLRLRMTLQDAIELMKIFINKGYELRLVVQNEKRMPFQCY